jgi:hypothetical protein
MRDLGADPDHLAAELETRDEWQLGLDLIFALRQQHVGKIDGDRPRFDEHLSRPDGRHRNLVEAQNVDRFAQFLDLPCAHAYSLVCASMIHRAVNFCGLHCAQATISDRSTQSR